jgi:hypothetical protein
LDGRHQGEIEETPLCRVPESLVNITQIQPVGLEGTVLLHSQGAEEEGENGN